MASALLKKENVVLVIEWKVDHGFLESTDTVAKSPPFHFLSTNWNLELHKCDGTEEWLSLLLSLNQATTQKWTEFVEFGLGMKNPDGTSSFEQKFIRKFRMGMKYGIDCFAKRSNLMERKNEMTALTIVCDLRRIQSPCENNAELLPGLLGMLSSNKHSDVTINVKDQVFKAHKVILSASSEVFSAMFGHEMSENNSGVLNIEDCEPESFKDFLNFVYTGATNITDSNVFHLYYIAHKYSVESLMFSCVRYMLSSLSVDTVCEVATLGHRYSNNDIAIACSDFFEENVREVLLTSQWKLLMKDNYLVASRLLENLASKITLQSTTQKSCVYCGYVS